MEAVQVKAAAVAFALLLGLLPAHCQVVNYTLEGGLTSLGGSKDGLLALISSLAPSYNLSVPANLTTTPGLNYLVDGLRAYEFFYPLVFLSHTYWYSVANASDSTNKFVSSGALATAQGTVGVPAPNVDTVYGRSVVDLTQGPVLLYVPPFTASLKYWSLVLYDYYQNVQLVLSSSTGSASGVNYIILQEKDKFAFKQLTSRPENAGVFVSPYPYLFLFNRILVETPNDLNVIHNLTAQQSITLLNGTAPNTFIPPYINSTLISAPVDPNDDTANLNFFQTAATLLQIHGPPANGTGIDLVLARLQISTQYGFRLDAVNALQQYALIQAVNIGFRLLVAKSRVPWSTNYPPWSVELDFANYGKNDYLNAVTAYYWGVPNRAEQAVYYFAREDSSGNPLTGAAGAWKITIPQYLPYNQATAFWSITAYSTPGYNLIINAINRQAFGDRTTGIVYNANGSFTIYLSGTAPTNPKKLANWLPAGNTTLTLVIRIYDPFPNVVQGLYAPPRIIKIA